ncbi:MAG: dipeptide epimerase [Cytophagales bacterium]|nr:dipeptide epimerase [Armatimonadota bacterium]
MKIFSLKAEPWDVPMRAPYRTAQRTTTIAHNVLVTVTLEDGTMGYGESAPAFYVTGETQQTVWEWIRDLSPLLRNRHFDDAEAFLSKAHATMPGAAGAVETAILDARARAIGAPLHRLLGSDLDVSGSRTTDLSLPLLTPEEASLHALQAAADGFRSLKVKVGSGSLEEDSARVRAIAAAAPTALLRLDGNQGFTPEEALTFLDSLQDLVPRIELLEQPTRAGDDAAMNFVTQRAPVPVFADESAHHAGDAQRLIEAGVCAGVVLKLAKSGIAETARIASAVHRAGGRCLFGCMMETHIATGAALHLAIALGEAAVPMLDLDGHLLVRDEDLLRGGFLQQGDVLTVNDQETGLGVTLLQEGRHR